MDSTSSPQVDSTSSPQVDSTSSPQTDFYNAKAIQILLVEDNPGDVRLTQEVLKEAVVPNRIHVVRTGIEALAFLRRQGQYSDAPRPDLILLDLNLPKKSGHEVLDEIKTDEKLKRIPVVVLTTSSADQDITQAYDAHANCYITKPIDLNQFLKAMKAIEEFWFTVVKLPPE